MSRTKASTAKSSALNLRLKFLSGIHMLFLILGIAISFSCPATQKISEVCNDLLTLGSVPPADLQIHAIRDRAMQSFLTSPRMLPSEEQLLPRSAKAFFFSNEFDFFKADFSLQQTDVVIGFGNNNAWDQAVRHNAKLLILADWDATPLQVQDGLFRPLVLAAKGPADFLSLLAGIPLPQSIAEAPLDDVFEYLMQRIEVLRTRDALDQPTHASQDELKSCGTFIKHRLQEMHALGLIDSEELYRLARYYAEYLSIQQNPESVRGELTYGSKRPSFRLGTFSGDQLAADLRGIFAFFRNRYTPKLLIDQGADPAVVHHPFFSFLSSQAAFDRLRHLFSGALYFAVTSANNVSFYEQIKELAQQRGLEGFAIEAVNIFSSMYTPVHNPSAMVRKLLKRLIPILADAKHPLIFHQTLGLAPPHKFETYSVGNEAELESTLAQYQHAAVGSEPLEYLSDADYILQVLATPNVSIKLLGTQRGETFFDIEGKIALILSEDRVRFVALRVLPGYYQPAAIPLFPVNLQEREAVIQAMRTAFSEFMRQFPRLSRAQMNTI